MFFGALLVANFVTVAGVPGSIESCILASDLDAMATLAAAVVVYLARGRILESSSLLLLTLPVFFQR